MICEAHCKDVLGTAHERLPERTPKQTLQTIESGMAIPTVGGPDGSRMSVHAPGRRSQRSNWAALVNVQRLRVKREQYLIHCVAETSS